MYKRELKKIKRRVKKTVNKKEFKTDYYIFVFGVSEASYHLIRELFLSQISVCGVIDNDIRKNHTLCAGVQVVTFDEFLRFYGNVKKKSYYFIYSPFWREMQRQLCMEDIPLKQIIVIRNMSWWEETFFFRTIKVMQGKKLYTKIRKKYGEDYELMLCPYTGTGDIYLIGTFLEQYLQWNHIEHYALIVVSKTCKKVTDLFSITNVEVIPGTDSCSDLIAYYMMWPNQCRLKILNDSWGEIYTNPTQWIRGYKGHNFADMFRRYVFELPEEAKPVMPILKNRWDEVYSLFKKYHLIPHKTVILSPYATTLADLPMEFWEKANLLLQKKGYTVCTNSCGDQEPAVAGTFPLFFPLDIAPHIVETAGGFIGIRSGFCDVISSAKAKKIILYDRNNWFYNCSAYSYFSLQQMEICKEVVEIEFTLQEMERILQQLEKIF